MGTTLWVLGKSTMTDGDDWDHSAMFDASEQLDGICASLGVPKLSGFFDWSDYNANNSDDGFPGGEAVASTASWFNGESALPTLRGIRAHLAAHPEMSKQFGDMTNLIEELDDCIAKVEALAAKPDPFHLCVVM